MALFTKLILVLKEAESLYTMYISPFNLPFAKTDLAEE
jgi:hypothetical protein